MSYLAFVHHPIALLIAVLASAPMVWKLARAWFPDPVEDAKEAAPYFLIDALGAPMIADWPLAKLIWVSDRLGGDCGDVLQDRFLDCGLTLRNSGQFRVCDSSHFQRSALDVPGRF